MCELLYAALVFKFAVCCKTFCKMYKMLLASQVNTKTMNVAQCYMWPFMCRH